MQNTKTISIKTEVLESITCDVCERTYTDELELQEFLILEEEGGFMSVFGDGVVFALDMCQYCLKEKLGQWIVTV